MKKALGGLMVALCLCLAGCAAHGQHTSQPVSASQSTPPTLGQHTASAETPDQSTADSSEPTSDTVPTQSSDQAASKPAAENTAPVMTGYLPRGDVIQIALRHAGLKQADICDLSCKLEEDDGVMIYQVEFEHGQYEYEYEIDAKTGKILDAEVDG